MVELTRNTVTSDGPKEAGQRHEGPDEALLVAIGKAVYIVNDRAAVKKRKTKKGK